MKLERFKKSNLQQSQNVFLVPPVSGGMPASRSAASTKKQTANQICHAHLLRRRLARRHSATEWRHEDGINCIAAPLCAIRIPLSFSVIIS